MVLGNLFSTGALAASVYLPEGRPHSRCEQSEKRMNSRPSPRGSKKKVSGAKKGVLKPVESGAESGG